MLTPEMQALVHDFATRLTAVIEADTARRLQDAIASAFAKPAAARAARPRPAASTAPSAERTMRRPATVTPALTQARKLQGRYLGAIRGLKLTDRARVKKLTAENGVAAGLKLALSLE